MQVKSKCKEGAENHKWCKADAEQVQRCRYANADADADADAVVVQ